MASATRRKPPRRTQEERSATTRAALLDATVDCLVEYGYANLTTTRVVERAGVSRGAQVHHFPTKAQLVTEAVRHLAVKRVQEFAQTIPELPKDDREADLPHPRPDLGAAHEPAVRGGARALGRGTDRSRAQGEPDGRGARRLQGDRRGRSLPHARAGRQADFQTDVQAAIAAIRGLAMLKFVEDPADTERRWKRTKKRLMVLFVQLDLGEAVTTSAASLLLSEEREEFRRSLRGFFERNSPEPEVRRLMDTELGHDPDGWRQLATELNLQGLVVPEEHGGSGYGWNELAIVFEEMGRALVCAPLFSTVALATNALLELGDQEYLARDRRRRDSSPPSR